MIYSEEEESLEIVADGKKFGLGNNRALELINFLDKSIERSFEAKRRRKVIRQVLD